MAVANLIALSLYLLSSAILIRRFIQRDPTTGTALPVGLLSVLALTFHAADIFFTMRLAGGWDLSLFSTMTLASWVMALLAYCFGSHFQRAHPGILIYPLVALTLLLKLTVPAAPVDQLATPALEWHVLLSLVAYSLFSLAAIQAVVLAFQERQLRQRQLGTIWRQLPPIQSMESSLFQLISAGFLLLTIGLITGFIFIDDIFAQHLVHKTVLSLFAWLVFATLLWGRWQYGWRGKTAINWTLIGFLLLVLGYFGSKFVLEFILFRS